MNEKPHVNVGVIGGSMGKTTLGAAMQASMALHITKQDDPPNIDGLADKIYGGWNAAMGNVRDDYRWGRTRRENPSQPSTSKASKEQKRQKKARKA